MKFLNIFLAGIAYGEYDLEKNKIPKKTKIFENFEIFENFSSRYQFWSII